MLSGHKGVCDHLTPENTSHPVTTDLVILHYKLPSAHQPMHNYLSAGGGGASPTDKPDGAITSDVNKTKFLRPRP